MPLIRRSYKSFAINCVRRKNVTKAAIIIGQDLQKEIAAICSDKFNSITRKKLNMVLKNFSLIKRSFMAEIESKAPTLLSLLKQCLLTGSIQRM